MAKATPVTKIASLLVLVLIIVLILFLFYRVMASFLLPLFLAALFSVLFRPIHSWMLNRFRGRETLAAGLTTASILGIVLMPLIWIGGMAVGEAMDFRGSFDTRVVVKSLNKVGRGWPVNFAGRPFDEHLDELDTLFGSLPTQVPDIGADAGLVEPLRQIERFLVRLNESVLTAIGDPDASESVDVTTTEANSIAANMMLQKQWIVRQESDTELSDLETQESSASAAEYKFVLLDELIDDIRLSQSYLLDGYKWGENIRLLGEADKEKQEEAEHDLAEFRKDFPLLYEQWKAVRAQTHGGNFRMRMHDLFFPTKSLVDWADDYMHEQGAALVSFEIGTKATAILGGFLAHLAIMVLGIFYFLKDGPGMIRAVMRLSPLDDRYEKELLSEFDSVSRAVVMATLLSAMAQGLLAGIGYYFVGFQSVLMLTMLTMVIAMVPVIGAAAVWIPACVWLAIVENRIGAAVGLAIYGASVISMIDNLIKPFVLHGQSNLHPLLALLSVLGGVSALGPIGIIVGPMVVSFLQALLNMLHLELQEFDRRVETESSLTPED